MLNGFVTKSSAPASKASTLSFSEFRTVSMMIAMLVSALMALQAARPPIPGILMSSSTRSGRKSRTFSRASSPVLASSTWYPVPVSAVRIMRRIWGSSSTTRMRPALNSVLPCAPPAKSFGTLFRRDGCLRADLHDGPARCYRQCSDQVQNPVSDA